MPTRYLEMFFSILDQMVCMGCSLLCFHKFFEFKINRRYKADAKRIYVSNFRRLPFILKWMCTWYTKIRWISDRSYLCNLDVFEITLSRVPSRLSISAVVMSYLQNPQPMSPPWWKSWTVFIFKEVFMLFLPILFKWTIIQEYRDW